MGRYVGCNKNSESEKVKGVVHSINKQAVNSRRVILLDSALELQVKPKHYYEKPKTDFSEVPTRQGHHIVFELNDHKSLIKSNKKQKVNFVDFIDCSKAKTKNQNKAGANGKQEFEHVKVKQKYLEESSSKFNKSTNNSMVLVQDQILKTTDKEMLKSSKPVSNAMSRTIEKDPLVLIKPKTILNQPEIIKLNQLSTVKKEKPATMKLDQPETTKSNQLAPIKTALFEPLKSKRIRYQPAIIKKEPAIIKKEPAITILEQPETTKSIQPATVKKVRFVPIKPKVHLKRLKAQQLKSIKSTPVHSMSSIDCANITEILSEQQLLNKKIHLQRVIKLHPLNLNTFKSNQNKKEQLSSILKTVIKNNLSNELLKNSSKKAFPVALKSTYHKDIKLLDFNSTNQSSEQILGM